VKIGVISDVHANIHALRAVWNALVVERGVEKVICLGDLVGYGASPLEVIEWLRQNNVATTLGASDARIAFELTAGDEHRQGVGDETLEWTKTLLGDEERHFLRGLKVTERTMTPVGRMRYFHGSPEDPEERLDLRGSPVYLDELLQKLNCSVVLCGGTHIPFIRRTEHGLFVNPGSVGLSLNGEPGADCALLEFNDSQLEVELLKIPYDFHAAAFDILTWGLPPVIADVIKTGSAKPQTA
jgi:putative phosphoesterase